MHHRDHPNTKRLFAIMADNLLKRRDVARLLECSEHTVSCWRSSQIIPDCQIDRLELKLEVRRLRAVIAQDRLPGLAGGIHA